MFKKILEQPQQVSLCWWCIVGGRAEPRGTVEEGPPDAPDISGTVPPQGLSRPHSSPPRPQMSAYLPHMASAAASRWHTEGLSVLFISLLLLVAAQSYQALGGEGERTVSCWSQSRAPLGRKTPHTLRRQWTEVLNWVELLFFLRRLHPQQGAWSHSPEIKSPMT